MPGSTADPYAVLGVSPQASAAEIKAAYRALVKQHHPDAGGDATTIVALNAAWAVLGDRDARRRHDTHHHSRSASSPTATADPNPAAGPSAKGGRGRDPDGELLGWLQQVYAPVDRLLAQVINPFPAELRALSADPYDDALMEVFCRFLATSQQRMGRAETLYRALACPPSARGLGLSLYHCLSQVQDALAELERYTMGYVDSYLRDGREMLRQAKRQRQDLHQQRSGLAI